MTKAKAKRLTEREAMDRAVRSSAKFVRLKKLSHLARDFESQGDYLAMADVLEKIADEMKGIPGFEFCPDLHAAPEMMQ